LLWHSYGTITCKLQQCSYSFIEDWDMRLDHDQIRAIMLDLEDKWPPGHTSLLVARGHRKTYLPSVELLDEELVEHLRCLEEAGFLRGEHHKDLDGSYDFQLQGITWAGHDFAQNARDSRIWKKATKIVGKQAASVSLSVLSAVLTDLVRKSVGLG
jgi:hypothetical protein